MRSLALVSILGVIASGCSEQTANTKERASSIKTSDGEQVPPEIAKALEDVSRDQSQGLSDAKVIVHRAYQYNGYTWIKPLGTAKVVAVDVEFRSYSRGLDLDDIDIIDGKSNENYGSDPQIASLNLEGNLAPDVDDLSWPADLRPLRVLLIYAIPKELNTIKLGYWGHELTPASIPIAGDGPLLSAPKPKK